MNSTRRPGLPYSVNGRSPEMGQHWKCLMTSNIWSASRVPPGRINGWGRKNHSAFGGGSASKRRENTPSRPSDGRRKTPPDESIPGAHHVQDTHSPVRMFRAVYQVAVTTNTSRNTPSPPFTNAAFTNPPVALTRLEPGPGKPVSQSVASPRAARRDWPPPRCQLCLCFSGDQQNAPSLAIA